MITDTDGLPISVEQLTLLSVCKEHGPPDFPERAGSGDFVVSTRRAGEDHWVVGIALKDPDATAVAMLEYMEGIPLRFCDIRTGQTFQLSNGPASQSPNVRHARDDR